MERLFRCKLEATSSSLWMMSGILAMLKRDGFNPSTPGLFNTAIASVSASLAFQARTTASGSEFLRSKRRESLLAHSKVPIPEPQKRTLIVTPGSDSGLFDEPLLDSVAAQVKEDSLVSSSLAVSKALSSRSGSKPLAVSSSPLAGPSTILLVRHSGRGSALLPPRALEAASASRVVEVGSFFEAFGFLEVGAIALPNPVRRLSVPPLAGLEGQGRGSVGGRGPPGGVLHTLHPASSSVCRPHPHAFVCPYFHQGGCSRGGHPGVDCQGCCGTCSSSLSRLLQLLVCGLEDLGVVATGHRPVPPQSFRGRFALQHGDYPICSSVCPVGGLDGLHRSSGGVFFRFLCIRNLVASCTLWLMAALTNSKRCASVCLWPRRSSLGLWLLCLLFFIPWVSVCVVTWTTGSSRPHPRRLSSGISGLSCPSVAS